MPSDWEGHVPLTPTRAIEEREGDGGWALSVLRKGGISFRPKGGKRASRQPGKGQFRPWGGRSMDDAQWGMWEVGEGRGDVCTL